jgi:hypothetical protein
MTAKRKTPKRKPYVNPVRLVLDAAQEAEKLRHEDYSIQTLQKLAWHNQEKLVPALTALMQWALDLQTEVNQIEAKLIIQLLAEKKGGKRVRKSA